VIDDKADETRNNHFLVWSNAVAETDGGDYGWFCTGTQTTSSEWSRMTSVTLA